MLALQALLVMSVLYAWSRQAPISSPKPQQKSSPGIIAYDCNSTSMDVLSYDLTQVKECSIPTNVTAREKSVRVQIVQKKTSEMLVVRRCKVTIHTFIWHCGMHSHTAIANFDMVPVPYEMTRQECLDAHENHRVDFDGTIHYNIRPNSSTTIATTAAGSVWGNGNCEGGTFHMHGYKYTSVVVKRSFEILLYEKLMFFKLGTEEVMGFGGVSCKLSESSCYDHEVGRMYWRIPNYDCRTSSYESLYAGSALLVETSSLGPTHKEYIRVARSGEKQFQLFTPLVNYESLCGLDGYTTPYHGLYIIMIKEHPPFPLNPPLVVNVDLIRYIETKFMTYAYGATLTTIDIIHQLAYSQCKSYRETLLNRLHIIAATPSSANLLVDNQPGIYGRVAGEVVHIIKCPPVQVHLRSATACSAEIPITYEGKALYMDSRTRIITDVYTHVSCGDLTPIMFRHGANWVKVTPAYALADSPTVLDPNRDTHFQFRQLVSYAHGGIYDPSSLQQLRDFMLFSSRREAMASNILSSLEGEKAPRYDFTKVMSEDGWETLAKDRLKQMWGNFQTIGSYLTGLLGIYFCVMVAKIGIGMIIRVFHIYQLTGMSWALLAGVWSTLTHVVMTRILARRPTTQDIATSAQHSQEHGEEIAMEVVPRNPDNLYPHVMSPVPAERATRF